MFKEVRALNKLSGEIINPCWIDSEKEGNSNYEFIEIPNDGKIYIWNGNQIIEKPIDIEELRQKGTSYYLNKAEQFKSIPIEILVNKSDNSTIIVKTDLLEKTLNNWVVVAMKVGEIKKANVINANTGLNEIISITDIEILRIRTILTELVDNLTALDVKVTNKIKTASDELIIAVFTLTTEQLEQFSLHIMNGAENILQMNDEQFDQFIFNLINQIKG